MRAQLKWAFLLPALPVMLSAQVSRQDRANPAKNPADDAKANSSSVPDVYAVTGHFDRIVVMRFKFKANLLGGMEKMMKQEHIQNAVILAGIGSVRGYDIHMVSNRDFPSHDVYETNPTQPADLVSMNGYVVNGKIHAHMTLSTPDKVIAGHLEPKTEVFTFAIVTVGVMNGTDLSKIDDKTYR